MGGNRGVKGDGMCGASANEHQSNGILESGNVVFKSV